jgi:F-type H+-transporting ATPase subunit b
MEQNLEFLKGILVRALPTFLLVILLHWYLKKMLFQPLERVLEERRLKTQGSVESSEAAVARAVRKMEDYEKALGDARVEIYQGLEVTRRKLGEKQAQALEAARTQSAERVAAAKASIAEEAEKASASLAAEADRLADQIADAVLAGSAQ